MFWWLRDSLEAEADVEREFCFILPSYSGSICLEKMGARLGFLPHIAIGIGGMFLGERVSRFFDTNCLPFLISGNATLNFLPVKGQCLFKLMYGRFLSAVQVVGIVETSRYSCIKQARVKNLGIAVYYSNTFSTLTIGL